MRWIFLFIAAAVLLAVGLMFWPAGDSRDAVRYSNRVKNMPQLRGVMSPTRDLTEEDLEVLAGWNVTLVRFQIMRNWLQVDTDLDLAEYDVWFNSRLDNLEKMLPIARRLGIRFVLDYHTSPGGRSVGNFMRMFDVVSSAIGLILLSPLMLAIALFIKIVSKGPIFFNQERIGLNKRSFTMLKFRTMIPDAEKHLEKLASLNEMDGPAFKIKNDPRIIPGGSFLRRHSLDELPQLWNVLRGDMSVVGPRPLSRRNYDLLKDDWQRKRFSMRPGLTCTWQVSGRNDVTFMQWMQMDLDYIDNWHFTADFWLIFKTFKTIFVGSGR